MGLFSLAVISALVLSFLPTASSQESVPFSGDRIYEATRSLSGGLDVGDPDRDGMNELAFCDFDGNVQLLEPDGEGGYEPGIIWQEPGPPGSSKGLFDLLIADVLDSSPGEEIMVGGYSRNLTVLNWDGSDWVSNVIYKTDHQIFDLALGDIDDAPGTEILFSSYELNKDETLRYLRRNAGDWEEVVIPLFDAVKAIEVADADPTVPGEEIWVTTAGGNDQGGFTSSLLKIFRSGPGDSWQYEEIFVNPENVIMNVRAGDIWSVQSGNEIVTAGLSGWCRVFWYESGSFERIDLFQAETQSGELSAIEGLAIGDFNRQYPGEEAMVSGYYNEVTQVIEVDGELEHELAWFTEASQIKMEIAGVEVNDLSPIYDGPEVMVASLQGWIEMLYLAEDELIVDLPSDIEFGQTGVRTVYMELYAQGSISGEVSIDVDEPENVTVSIPPDISVEPNSRVDIPMTVGSTYSGSENKEVDIGLSIEVAGRYWNGTLPVTLKPSAGMTLLVEPPNSVIYDAGVGNIQAQVSIYGASDYDYLDLSVGDIPELQESLDTPLDVGSTANLLVTTEGHPDPGSYSLTLTASFEGVTVAQTTFSVRVEKLSDYFNTSLRKVAGEENRYLVDVGFNGPLPVSGMNVKLVFDDEIVDERVGVDIQSGESISFEFSVGDGEKGDLEVWISTLTDHQLPTLEAGEVEYLEDDDDQSTDRWVFILGIIIILCVLLVLVWMLLFYRPGSEGDEEASLQDIGGARRYKVRPEPGRRNLPSRDERRRPGRVERGPLPRREGPRTRRERPGERGRERAPPRFR